MMAMGWRVGVLCILALACLVLAEEPKRSRAPWRWSSDDDDFSGFGLGDRDDDDDDDSFRGDSDGAGSNVFGDRARGGIPFDREKANNIRNVHGILAAVLFVGIFPLGAILIRVAKRHVWLHACVQVLALGGYVAAAGLGIWLALYVRIPQDGGTINLFQEPSINFHPIIGLVVLTLLTLQPLWGALHHTRYLLLRRRTAYSDLHLWTGRLAIPLGMVNGALGLWRSGASSAVLTSYSVVAGVVWAVWMVFAGVHEVWRGRSKVKEEAEAASEGTRSPGSGSRVSRSRVSGSRASGSPREGSGRVPTVSSLSSDERRSGRAT